MTFTFVAVDSKAPFRTILHSIAPESMALAEAAYRKALEQIAGCFDRKDWADEYENVVTEHTLKHWIFETKGESQ